MFLPHAHPAPGSAQEREFQRQHEEIFGTLESVRVHRERSSRGRLVLAYDEFLACTKAHFQAEELLLARCEPARLPAHLSAHQVILRRALALRDRVEQLDPAQLLLQLQIVEGWLTDHSIDEGARLV
jgi:hemerythrin-like metal-binding protein